MKSFLIISSVSSLLLASCVATGHNSMSGGIFSDAKDVVYASGKIGSKTGKSCAKNYLGLVSFGDTSSITAANNGNIKEIRTIDTETKTWAVYGETCTVITGE
jgi:hypothetical protein